MNFKYRKVILGGTFDLLHIGHQKLILKAFEVGEKVVIGVSSDEFNRKRGKETYQSQVTRVKNLEKFLRQNNFQKRCSTILINDIFGTSLIDPEIEAIVVTPDTVDNANLVNRKRLKKGFQKLDLVTVAHAKDKRGQIISSSRIRIGEISSDGINYKNFLLKIADKKFDQKILKKFKKPLGKLVKKIGNKNGEIITVGDITTGSAFKMGIQPKIGIIDFKTRRRPVILNVVKDIYSSPSAQNDRINNPPSTISKKLINEIEKILRSKKSGQIVVEGEEDLATIPAILLSPFGIKVYYGQPNEGLVEVIVTEKAKDKLLYLLGLQ